MVRIQDARCFPKVLRELAPILGDLLMRTLYDRRCKVTFGRVNLMSNFLVRGEKRLSEHRVGATL